MALSTMNSSRSGCDRNSSCFSVLWCHRTFSKTSWMISLGERFPVILRQRQSYTRENSFSCGGWKIWESQPNTGCLPFTYFCSILFYFLFSGSPGKSHTHELTFSILSDDERLGGRHGWGVLFQGLPRFRLSVPLCSFLQSGYAHPRTEIKQMAGINSFLLHNTEAQTTGGGRGKPSEAKAWCNNNLLETWELVICCLSGV